MKQKLVFISLFPYGLLNIYFLLQNTISLSQQLENYREYKNKLVDITGKFNASSRISRGIHLISAGSSDFLQNYYINPLLFTTYTPDTFSDILLNSYDHFIQVFPSIFFLNKKTIQFHGFLLIDEVCHRICTSLEQGELESRLCHLLGAYQQQSQLLDMATIIVWLG